MQILTTWRYVPGDQRTFGLHDDLLNFVPGSFDEVEAAFTDELIDADLYHIALSTPKQQSNDSQFAPRASSNVR
ncbi:hypothetical protein [Clavibacter nebraskensis]|uniref:hypothetical protein n=1 Tax=Clavibacter nebraskensis TaxID=31963 RepID=UPI003D020F06